MAQLTYAQALALNDTLKLLAALVSGVGPDGSTAGSGSSGGSSSAVMRVTTELDTDGTTLAPVGFGSTSYGVPIDLQLGGVQIGNLSNPVIVEDIRAKVSTSDDFAIGARSPTLDSASLQTYTSFRDEAVTNTKVLLHAGATFLADLTAYNPHATAFASLHFFDAAATADVTLGSTTPKFSIPLNGLGGYDKAKFVPKSFTLGVVYVATASYLKANTSAPTTAVYLDGEYI